MTSSLLQGSEVFSKQWRTLISGWNLPTSLAARTSSLQITMELDCKTVNILDVAKYFKDRLRHASREGRVLRLLQPMAGVSESTASPTNLYTGHGPIL
jgi:hypothetical protein